MNMMPIDSLRPKMQLIDHISWLCLIMFFLVLIVLG